ncbi:hypothetical protein FF125_00615 [Aureibaculum algae]|uniref:O-antigen ligase domain-containing protein n=2 Tax=Aureibaculum algae TaxID=2584122 RepID=A0A5B7TQ10_9FLAO|nr:hypothetical protein FF125_00615 [Aureibaculum algae]
MNINWFVFIIIVVITFIVIFKKEFKYIDAFVFFIPFNATVVFSTHDSTAINLPFILFVFAAISYFINKSLQSKFTISKSKKNIINWLIVIGFIAIFSQIMPYIIDGKYMVLDRYKESIYWAKEEALYPSMQWVTQTIYFLIGLLVVIVVSDTYKTISDIKKVLKLLLAGITFMIFWGWFGDLTYFLGIPYPQFFNQIGMNKLGIESFNGYPRMSSVTMEASYFAQILIPTTPYFYWFSQQNKTFIFDKTFHKRMYLLSIITLPLAITTTGVLGFFIIIGLLLKNSMRLFTLKSKYFLVSLYSILVLTFFIFSIKYLINISGTYSGIERFKTVHYGVFYFLDYPILGLGWGVFPTYDFIINLLVNFGLLGAIPFLILLYNIFIKLHVKIKKVDKNIRPLFKAAIESFILILIDSQLSGFIYHSQYFWLYIGLAVSIGSLELNKESL